MEKHPNREDKNDNRDQAIPGPDEKVGLDGVDRNHEIVAEPGMAQKGSVFWVAPADTAIQREPSQRDDQAGYDQVDGVQVMDCRVPGGWWDGGVSIQVQPLGTGPEKAETGLNGGSETLLGRSQFAEQQGKVKGNDAPDQRQVLERRPYQLSKKSKVMVKHRAPPTAYRNQMRDRSGSCFVCFTLIAVGICPRR